MSDETHGVGTKAATEGRGAWLPSVADDAAEGDLAELYAADRARLGHVANYTRAFSTRPAVYRAWQALGAAVRDGVDATLYELATVGAARALGSSYCSLAHGEQLAELIGESAVVDLAEGVDVDRRQAVVDFAGKVARGAATITTDDLDALRDKGITDDEILSVILTVAARCFFSTVLDATGTRAEASYGDLPESLRAVLVVGRPISDDRDHDD